MLTVARGNTGLKRKIGLETAAVNPKMFDPGLRVPGSLWNTLSDCSSRARLPFCQWAYRSVARGRERLCKLMRLFWRPRSEQPTFFDLCTRTDTLWREGWSSSRKA
jgi:hypothetical protein